MRTADFDYELPPELIAQRPVPQRDQSRLLVLQRRSGWIKHRQFRDVREYLRAGDVLALNNSSVIPARLRGVNACTGGQFEILLLEENAPNDWWAMLRPARRARVGTQIEIRNPKFETLSLAATVRATNAEGHRRLRFSGTPDISGELDRVGEVPLPPYILREDSFDQRADRDRYQTVFSGPAGSVAAPTAGLHFTEGLLDEIRARGVHLVFLTLHVGLATFAPVKTETLSTHRMHEERYEIGTDAADIVNRAKAAGRRVIAVGTTTVRVLESAAAAHDGRLAAGAGRTRMFIYPPHEFRIVDAMLTNFHLPRSTLLMLVSAFATPGETRGCDMILRAYGEAIRERYRFYSYGDAMLIL